MGNINLQELLKEVNLSDEQSSLLGTLQKTVDDTIISEVESAASGLKTKNQELIGKLKDAKEKAIPEGFDMDSYNEYIENKDKILADKLKAEEEALIASQNWDKLKNDMTNNHEATINKITADKDSEINNLKSALDHILIENVALKEIEKVEGSSTLLMPHVKDAIQTFKDENGKYSVKVIDDKGKDRMNVETGEPLKVSELIAEFQANEAFAGAFPIQNKGSEAEVNISGTNYNSTNNPFDKSSKHYSITEQAKLNKNNPALAKTLKESVQ